MGIYVQQQLEYGKLWKLVEFSQVPAPSRSCSPSMLLSVRTEYYPATSPGWDHNGAQTQKHIHWGMAAQCG